MSHVADVNSQSSISKLHFHNVFHCFQCFYRTRLLYVLLVSFCLYISETVLRTTTWYKVINCVNTDSSYFIESYGLFVLLIYRRDVEAGCVLRPPVFSTSARRGVSLSAIALLLLLARDSGTVYLMMSSLPHLSQHFVRN